MATRPLPATGAWMPGQPSGSRKFHTFAADRPFALEGGITLHGVTLAYETWGRLDPDGGNAVPTAQDSGWTFPSDWNWDALFDYDGDGSANYTTTNTNAMYGLMRAKEAVDAGYTIHTMTVGLGGDPTYMEAIAHLGGGITITVPGDQTVEEMQADILAAFNKIAAFVPPARLVKPE